MRRDRTARIAAAALAVGLLPSLPAAAASAAPRAKDEGSRPNVVFVLTDDLDVTTFLDAERFPEFDRLLVDQGTTFSNFFVTDSLCCPSRASTLRGQYVHSHQVLGNLPPSGGFEQFHALGEEASTVATWIDAAGYRTGLFGKYLNGYPTTVGPSYVPPGWDEWVSPSGGNPYAEYNYQLNENGTLVEHGAAPEDYLVDVLTQKTDDFIRSSARAKQPFFAYVAPYVPHQPATPAPRHLDAFPGVSAPRTASFDQADVDAEPTWLRNQAALAPETITYIDALYRRRLQSMLGVEDMIASIVDTLRDTGHLDDTYIVFSSDNGFHLGEHRLSPGKQTAFDEDIRVPLVVRGPMVPAGKRVDDFASNIDLAPTFAALARAKAPAFVEGQSLVPALHDEDGRHARDDVLVEHYARAGTRAGRAEGRRGGQRAGRRRQAASSLTAPTVAAAPDGQTGEPDDDSNPPVEGLPPAGPNAPVARPAQLSAPLIPEYAALRTARYLYVEYVTGERQLYDLRKDPDELHNLAATASADLLAGLATRLAQLRACGGVTCRRATQV